MNQHVSIPGWDDFSARLKEDLNYSETMLERTFYTYRSFVQKFCLTDEDDAAEKVKKGIDNVSTAYQKNEISKDQLLRMRRLAYRLLMYMDTGKISWKRAPLYGKKFGNDHNEALLGRFLENAWGRHAESILRRDESTIRQFILYFFRKIIDLFIQDHHCLIIRSNGLAQGIDKLILAPDRHIQLADCVLVE